jgi:hypothetical protein
LVYGDLALRQFGDLDILVHKDDVLRVKDLLVSCGYRPLFRLPNREEALFFRWEYPFVSGGGEVFVDLHWGMTPGYFAGVVDSELQWERLERLSLEGQPILTLSAPDLFLHLCMHGAKHHWGRLDWICDLAQLIHHGKEMDWCWIMEQSHRCGSKRMTCLGMFLAHALFGVHVPQEARREVRRDKRLEPLAEKVYSRLFQKADGRNLLLEEIRFYLRTMDRSRDRIRYCLDRLIKPTPWSVESLCLPSSLYFLYYFLRPLQLIRQYGFRQSYSESIPK